MEKNVSVPVVRRLPRYYRYLGEMIKKGITRISSKELSEAMGVTASQIRQDLNNFGGFGQQGYGYNIELLYQEIGNILGINKGYTAVLIGAGNLGHALANHSSLQKRGVTIAGIFDNNPKVIGTLINGHTVLSVYELDSFVQKNKPDIGIITTPKNHSQEIAEKLINLGIKGLWNFSYIDLKSHKDVAIENVHLSDSLMTLSYKITRAEGKK